MGNIKFSDKPIEQIEDGDYFLCIKKNGNVRRVGANDVSVKFGTDNNYSGNSYPSGRISYVNPGMGYTAIKQEIERIDALGGGTVFFDVGVYELEGALTIGNGTSLIGAGERLTTIKAKVGANLEKVRTSINTFVHEVYNPYREVDVTALIYVKKTCRYCTIQGMTIDGIRWEQAFHSWDDWHQFYCQPTDNLSTHKGAVFGILVGSIDLKGPMQDLKNHPSEPDFIWTKPTSERNLTIRDVCVTGCDFGLMIGAYNFLTNVDNLYALYNGFGGANFWANTDSTSHNIVAYGNGYHGISVYSGGNQRIYDCKVLFNGYIAMTDDGTLYNAMKSDWGGVNLPMAFGENTAALYFQGARMMMSNVDVQDNFCLPVEIDGDDHEIANFVVDSSQKWKNNDAFPNMRGKLPAVRLTNLHGCHMTVNVVNGQGCEESPFTNALHFRLSGGTQGNNDIKLIVGDNNVARACPIGADVSGGAGMGILRTPSGDTVM